jgi:hypothetical protein
MYRCDEKRVLQKERIASEVLCEGYRAELKGS